MSQFSSEGAEIYYTLVALGTQGGPFAKFTLCRVSACDFTEKKITQLC